ncbi:helix-turn-helix transcriptional regulator [Lactococcus lactis]|uniref:XRE family transcriptional regulator n=1 Tax=Lactococcus lactis TaxID=1358 RepID=UPI00191230E4|nr:XRE family transcriptional regulator [Lactococcus lactis]MBK5077293.1 helix-turn-helix transcriptional regulator [Lactococcus lactis]
MNLSERLKSLRLEQGYTQKELANKLGIAYQNIQKYEKGIAKPLNKNLENLAEVFQVSVSYLMGETNIRSSNRINEIMEQLSEPRQEETINFAEEKLIEQNSENKIIQLRSSLVSYEVATEQALSAGLGEGYTDNIETTTVYWDKNIDYDIGIPIKGDSMEPDYQSGQIALIKYQSCSDYDGQVCAVDNISVGDAFIKCVTCQEDGILLESLNVELNQYGERKFPDKKISWEDNPRIIGKVVAAFTPIEINNIF